MTNIRITRFGGMDRTVTDRHLREGDADVAHNAELRDGSLRAFRTPKELKCQETTIKTVVETPELADCCAEVLCFDDCVSVTYPQDPDCSGMSHAVIWHEDCAEPERLFCETGEKFPLVVPRPTARAQAWRNTTGQLVNDPNQSPDQRAYTYTWVDRFGVESPPAFPTATDLAYDDEVWRFATPETPPPNAAYIRIYRSSAEFGSGIDVAQQNTTTFQLVEEIPIDQWTGTFDDTLRLKDLCFGTLCTIQDCAPPCLKDVQELDSGYHVGFTGQEIWFSERHEPHNWPERYKLTLPFAVRGLAVNNTLVYVGTAGNPFLIRTGTEVDALTEDTVLRAEPVMYDQKYPMVGRRTITATAWGAAYVGREGIIGMQPSLPARNITRQHIDEDQWLRFVPNRLTWLNGRLFAGRAPGGPGFILDVRGEPEGPRDYGQFVTVDYVPNAAHASFSGRVLFSEGGCAYEWDAGDGLLEYCWKSRRYIAPGRTMPRAAKVVGDYGPPVTFRVWRDNELVYERDVRHSRPFRLPRFGAGIEYQIELKGRTTIHEVHLAPSIAEMAMFDYQQPAAGVPSA